MTERKKRKGVALPKVAPEHFSAQERGTTPTGKRKCNAVEGGSSEQRVAKAAEQPPNGWREYGYSRRQKRERLADEEYPVENNPYDM